MSIKINNLNGNVSKINSDINNRNNRLNALDKLTAHLSEVKKNSQKVEKNQFYGVCLFYNRMTVSEFRNIFKSNEEFTKYIYGKYGVVVPNEAGTILQIFANIPEITGMLPEVNIQKMQDLINLNSKNFPEVSTGGQNVRIAENIGVFDSEASIEDDISIENPSEITLLDRSLRFQINLDEAGRLGAQNLSQRNPKTNLRLQLTEELNKASMYPRFYLYTEENYTPAIGQILLFEFPSLKGEYLPTMGIGAFVDATKNTIDLLYPKPKKKPSTASDTNSVPTRSGILQGSPSDGTELLGAASISESTSDTLAVPEVTLSDRSGTLPSGMTPRPSRNESE